MREVKMVMPKMGESIMEATILKWLKKVGDNVDQDEAVLEVATDKVDTEVPSVHAGVLKEVLFKEGDVVTVGSAIAILESKNINEDKRPSESEPISPSKKNKKSIEPEFQKPLPETEIEFKSSSKYFSPLVKNIAKQEKLTLDELESISGSGASGRVTKNDVLKYLQSKKTRNDTNAETITSNLSTPPSILVEDEIIEMDRIRKMIASRMVNSKRTSPHVTSFVEADLSNVVKWRNKIKSDFAVKEGESITFTPIIIHAIVKAIMDFPMINIQVDGDQIIVKKSINIGMAVAQPSGNLIVPVIPNADKFDLKGLVKVVNDFARRAKDNNLKADELANGTFTFSNVGVFGNVMGTPIIMQPQVAILAAGVIKKKPAVLELPEGDVIAIRHKMFLSHSYDHRVVDGALGGNFVRRVSDYLENFDTNQTI